MSDSKNNSQAQFNQAPSLNDQANFDNLISNNSAPHLPAQTQQPHQPHPASQPQQIHQAPQPPQTHQAQLQPEQAQVSIPTINFNNPTIIDIGVSELRALIPRVEILLLTVNDWERKALLSEMTPIDGKDGILQGALDRLTYHIGMFGNYCAAYTESTMGSGGRHGATLTAKIAVDELKPKAVLLLGIAFGIDSSKQKLGDVLIAESIQPYEYQKVNENFSIHRGQSVPCGNILSERFRMRRNDWIPKHGDKFFDDVKVHQGLVLSGEKVVNNKDFRDTLVNAFPTSIGGEMEGVGAYSAVSSPVEVILIKSICDWADGDKNDKAQPFAAFTATSLAKHILSKPDVLIGLVNNKQWAISEPDTPKSNNYDSDIEQLKKYSQSKMEQLANTSLIRTNSDVVKISRNSTEQLKDGLQNNSVVIVGDPGIGKSGILSDLMSNLMKSEHTIVCLSCDFLMASNTTELSKELGIQHNFLDVIKNWSVTKTAYLVIDGLDKALASPSELLLVSIISNIINQRSLWKVIASIRKYELNYHHQLKSLFAGQPLTERSNKVLQNVCYFEVTELTDQELAQIQNPSKLINFINNANPNLKNLLKNVFNLRLLTELLIGTNVNEKSLNLVKTQIELLDTFWRERTSSNENFRYSSISMLKKILEEMITTKIPQITITTLTTDNENNEILIYLLKSNIIKQVPDKDIITFSHNILFDYALARLLIRNCTTDDQVITFLEARDYMLLLFRASVILHFQYLWVKDIEDHQHINFWQFNFKIQKSEKIPQIGKLIGPGEAAKMVTTLSDYSFLLNTVKDRGSSDKEAAEQILLHIINSITTTLDNDSISNTTFSAWFEIIEEIAQKNILTSIFAEDFSILIAKLCQI